MQHNPSKLTPGIHVPTYVSIGIIAWNEEDAIAGCLASVLDQSLFAHLADEGRVAEIVVMANGCTDATEARARDLLSSTCSFHPARAAIRWEVISIAERGKFNAWNKFVHQYSASEGSFLILLDADILLRGHDTLWNLCQTLREDVQAKVSVDTPHKLFQRKRVSLANALSQRAATVTISSPGQITGQLYCIRSEVARNIYLPRDLAACDDGFIKALVSTDFLTAPLNTKRVCTAPDAGHVFEAYTSPRAVLRNQKRQVIGQTIVHILVDRYLPTLRVDQRLRMAETLRRADAEDPDWLKRLIAEHVACHYPWRLYPNLLTYKLEHLWRLPMPQRIACLPATLAQLAVTVTASVLASQTLKRGCTDYWPKAGRGAGLNSRNTESRTSWNGKTSTKTDIHAKATL